MDEHHLDLDDLAGHPMLPQYEGMPLPAVSKAQSDGFGEHTAPAGMGSLDRGDSEKTKYGTLLRILLNTSFVRFSMNSENN